jgi:hypothetical protein
MPRMTRAIDRLLCAALVGVAITAGAARAQPADVPATVERLLQGFGAGCPQRWRATEEVTDRMIGQVMKYGEPGVALSAGLRERAASKGTAVERRVQAVLKNVADFEQAFARLTKTSESVDRSGTEREVWRKVRSPLTKALEDPAETFTRRRLAAAMISEVSQQSRPAAEAGWDQPLPRLLASSDPTARLIGSVIAASGGLLPRQAPTHGQVVPELLRGLDADSFAARYDSTRALLKLSQQSLDRFCVDPSDEGADRAAGVRTWQAWWQQNKARTANELIPQ